MQLRAVCECHVVNDALLKPRSQRWPIQRQTKTTPYGKRQRPKSPVHASQVLTDTAACDCKGLMGRSHRSCAARHKRLQLNTAEVTVYGARVLHTCSSRLSRPVQDGTHVWWCQSKKAQSAQRGYCSHRVVQFCCNRGRGARWGVACTGPIGL